VAAAAFARSRKPAAGRVEAIGQAGLRPRRSARAIDVAGVIAGVQAQMHPYEKNLFRSGDRLRRSARELDALWAEVRDHAAGADPLREREAAALLATARWSVCAALHRTESRGLHLREDHQERDPRQAHRLETAGLEEPFSRPDVFHPPAPSARAVRDGAVPQAQGAPT
jgi:L-aspartate oxidase